MGNASPVVNGSNMITSNSYGVRFDGGSLTTLPVVTGNQIFDNPLSNVSTQSGFSEVGEQHITLNFTGNWWGTTDASFIANTIYDLSDNATSVYMPTVNYSNFLNAAGGTPVAGNYLIGPLTATATTLTAGVTYDVLGITYVPAGKSLTIPAGTFLRFTPGTKLVISGSLTVSGTLNSEVVFTSAKVLSSASDWAGIEIKSDAAAVSIQNAIVQYATNGITIDNTASVVNVSDSLIQLCNYGIYINGNTKPVIARSRIVSNAFGININGTNNNATDPKPILKNNDIYNNASNRNISINNYTASPTIKIDISSSWWGTAAPTFSSTIFNYTPLLTSASLAPILNTHLMANSYFSPNGDAVQDTANLTSTLSETASWTVNVKNLATGIVVRTYSGTGSNANISWDGKNASAQTMVDGRYSLIARATASTRSGVVLYKEIVLDNTLPGTNLDPFLSMLPHKNVLSISIKGSANDQNFLHYSVDYSNNLLPTVWNALSTNIIYQTNNALLSTWTVSSTVGDPAVANGTYSLRLVAKDLAGNQSVVTAPVTIDNLTLTNVIAPGAVNLRTNTPAAIKFSTNLPGSVTIKIYDVATGPTGTPIRTLTLNSIAGVNTVNWDGRDQGGARVQGIAYVFVIEASDGSHSGIYNPTNLVISTLAHFPTTNQSCDAYRNIFASFSITAPQPGLAAIQLSTANGMVYPFGVNGKPIPAGTTTLYWDCRDPLTGALVSFPADQTSAFIGFPPNTILVDGVDSATKIKGSGVNVEVKSNPYLIYLSFAQFTKISYNLELFNAQSTLVEIKLLPPLVLNFDDPQAVLIFSGVQGAGDHEVTWKGYVGTTENAKRATSSTEGAYTFAIKATTNGVSSLYRGTLNVYQ